MTIDSKSERKQVRKQIRMLPSSALGYEKSSASRKEDRPAGPSTSERSAFALRGVPSSLASPAFLLDA